MRRMKNSGILWMGEIPAEWEILKTGWVFDEIGSGTTPKGDEYYDGDVAWLNTGDLNDGYIFDTAQKITDRALREVSALRLYSPQALVIAMYGATIGKLGLTKIELCTNQACCVMNKPCGCNMKYMFYSFLAIREYLITLAYGGGQPNISQGLINSLRFCIPPLNEQQKISAYLDQKTSEIDDTINDYQAMVEKLNDYRRSVITEATTKGLDPNVRMKDSGIPWIGEIPEGWNIRKFKYVCELYPRCETSSLNDDDTITFTPMECVRRGKLELRTSVFSSYSSSYNLFLEGDILLAKVTPCFENENIVIAKGLHNGIGFGSSEFFVIRNTVSNNVFLYYYLQGHQFVEEAKTTMSGTGGLKRVSSDFMRNGFIPCPPLDGQQKISDYLDQKTTEIDTHISDITNQIEKLKEYRQSVIFEAITGKVEV